jgi:hypothetical protein
MIRWGNLVLHLILKIETSSLFKIKSNGKKAISK